MNPTALLFITCILVCEIVGLCATPITMRSIKTWYVKLKKPSFNPPSYIFGPVWTTLYALMGISFYLILINTGNKVTALTYFIIQLILNGVWSFIFFYWKKIFIAFIEILFMLFFIILTAISFWPLNHIASLILLPYLFWVSFATVLNGTIWKLNK